VNVPSTKTRENRQIENVAVNNVEKAWERDGKSMQTYVNRAD